MESEDPIYIALYKYTKALSVALGYRDQLTRLHSERVRGLSIDIGARLGLNEHDMGVLSIGSSFHDIGKIGIPDHILLKPAQFDKEEWEIMRRHPLIGEEIIASTELEGSQKSALVIRHHHEHFNGDGYPDGLVGEEIPIQSRIISIADGYDAMAVIRSYHRPRKHSEIMDILFSETGKKYDPDIMQIFLEIIEHSQYKASEN